MHKKFEINWTKIKGGCQSGSKVVPHDSKSYLPLPIIQSIYKSSKILKANGGGGTALEGRIQLR